MLVLLLFSIDRPSFFSIVMFVNAAFLFSRTVCVKGNHIFILEQHKRKLEEVCVSVSSYHVRFIVGSIDCPSYFSIFMFVTVSAVSIFSCRPVDVNCDCDHLTAVTIVGGPACVTAQ